MMIEIHKKMWVRNRTSETTMPLPPHRMLRTRKEGVYSEICLIHRLGLCFGIRILNFIFLFVFVGGGWDWGKRGYLCVCVGGGGGRGDGKGIGNLAGILLSHFKNWLFWFGVYQNSRYFRGIVSIRTFCLPQSTILAPFIAGWSDLLGQTNKILMTITQTLKSGIMFLKSRELSWRLRISLWGRNEKLFFGQGFT